MRWNIFKEWIQWKKEAFGVFTDNKVIEFDNKYEALRIIIDQEFSEEWECSSLEFWYRRQKYMVFSDIFA